MLTRILSILLNMLPAQVCATVDQSSIYIDVDECERGHSHLCWVGDSPQPWYAVVCCGAEGLCDVRAETCNDNQRAVCRLPTPGQICMSNALTYFEPGLECDPGTEHACNVGEFGVPDPYAIACCANDDCVPATYPGECPMGYVAMCEMN